MAEQPRISTLLTQRHLRFLGHVSRMEDDCLPKQLLVSAPVGGKRQSGGQKKRWNDVVCDDLKKCSLPSNWRELAQECRVQPSSKNRSS